MPVFPDDYTRGVCEFRNDDARSVFSPSLEWIPAFYSEVRKFQDNGARTVFSFAPEWTTASVPSRLLLDPDFSTNVIYHAHAIIRL